MTTCTQKKKSCPNRYPRSVTWLKWKCGCLSRIVSDSTRSKAGRPKSASMTSYTRSSQLRVTTLWSGQACTGVRQEVRILIAWVWALKSQPPVAPSEASTVSSLSHATSSRKKGRCGWTCLRRSPAITASEGMLTVLARKGSTPTKDTITEALTTASRMALSRAARSASATVIVPLERPKAPLWGVNRGKAERVDSIKLSNRDPKSRVLPHWTWTWAILNDSAAAIGSA